MKNYYQFLIDKNKSNMESGKKLMYSFIFTERGNVMSNKIMIERNIGVLRDKIRNADKKSLWGVLRLQ